MYTMIVVEDEDIIRRGIIFGIDYTSLGIVIVAEADNGEEGLRLIKEFKPDIVMSDIRMHGISGLEMIEEASKFHDFGSVIISGYSDFAYAKRAVHLDVTEYILKPVNFSELEDALRQIIRRKGKIRHIEKSLEESSISLDDDIPNLEKVKNKYAKIMLSYIMENYPYKISITDLSKKMDISCNHLNSSFKGETGYTFHNFLNYYRIHKAVEMQKEGGLKLYEIAENVGFSDYKYFNKVYKKYMGCPPAAISEKFDK